MDLTHSMPSFKDHHAFDSLPDKSEDPAYISPDRSHYCVPTNSLLSHPLVSPLFAKGSQERPLPPILIQVGDAEKLRDENLSFYATSFPTENIHLELYEDMVHVFQLLAPVDSFCQMGIDRIGRWMDDDSRQRACLWIRRRRHQGKEDAISLQGPDLAAMLSSTAVNE